MFLADYHTHTHFSPDGSSDGFAELFAAAGSAGLDELCVTDHCDMSRPEPFPADQYFQAFQAAKAGNLAKTRPLLGIELGDPLYDLSRADATVAAHPYDFILCSLHAMRKETDFYWLEYTSEEHCRRVLDRYFAELCEMAAWGGFDVLGHIDYPLRQMRKAGFHVNFLPRYQEEMREVLSLCAANGLGIELNFRITPLMEDILPIFKECGGEIITLGSDAHCAADIGRGIKDGPAMCAAAGFRYTAAFEKRKVRFEKIS